MKKISYSIGILSVILVLGLTSCKQDTINKLQGEWRMIPTFDLADTLNETWEFTSDGDLIVRRGGTIITSGKYTVQANFLDTKLVTTELTNNFNYYEAEWYIIQLKRTTLYINNDKDGGLYTREFERD